MQTLKYFLTVITMLIVIGCESHMGMHDNSDTDDNDEKDTTQQVHHH